MNRLCAIVLAAGAGTRMKSSTSKLLHPLAGRPLLHYPVMAALRLGAEPCVVVASPSHREAIEQSLKTLTGTTRIEVQERPLGSGDAARAAVDALPEAGPVLVLNGDAPLVTELELDRLLRVTNESQATLGLLACTLLDPTGYGRVLRDERGRVVAIAEEKDLKDNAQRAVKEVNAGLYCADAAFLRQSLGRLQNDNAQGEYYITDLIAMAAAQGEVIAVSADASALQGVNDRVQLDALEQTLFQRIADRHRRAGVTVRGDARIDDAVLLGPDTTVAAGVCLRGACRIGSDVLIDTGCVVTDAVVERGATLLPYCVVTSSHVGERVSIGPFAHVRPSTRLDADSKLGNFVETKAAHFHAGAKANHLSYIGDGEVGEGSNIGAGTIFCNYDGISKAKTTLGKGVFIGSDSQLVAPVNVGDGAYVATGTTVVEDVPADALAIGRERQVNKPGYASVLRERLAKKRDGA